MEFRKFNEALRLVIRVHANQKDKAGVPYVLHLTRVAGDVANMFKGVTREQLDDLMTTALLHDIVEDHDYPIQAIQILFGSTIAEAVVAMTKVQGITYRDYIENVGNNWLSLRVKICDLKHNMDYSRMPTPTDDVLVGKDMRRMSKYAQALQKLTIKLEEEG